MVRTRFAPSPTGKLHVGNVRTALFAWLYARHTGGRFVLRIEDTDLERSNADFTVKLMEDLKWLGLTWDEGPVAGGPAAPYSQSERLDIYKQYAEKLINEGRAYRCYCTPDEVEADKTKAQAQGLPPHYSGRCRSLTAAQEAAFRKEGREPVVRFIPYDDDFSFADRVKGEVVFPRGMVGDFVIMRGNGLPVYNFAVVVDDALMQITHVLRADEHLSNTVRQLMIYKALGFKVPEFGHMALVLGPDRQKLSKRHGATSVDEFRSRGYLPEAVINYLSMLGWSSPDGREILSTDELIALFDLDRLSPSPAVFDTQKLNWVARHYIISADKNRLFDLTVPFLKELGVTDESLRDPGQLAFLKGVVELTKGYCSHLAEIKEHAGYFLSEDFPVTGEAAAFLSKPESRSVIECFKKLLENEKRTVDEKVFVEMADKIKTETGQKGKNLFMPLRAALTGRVHGPEIYFLTPLIGKERTMKRLDRALGNMGS